jgi:primosomal protein N' (replication factor Y)
MIYAEIAVAAPLEQLLTYSVADDQSGETGGQGSGPGSFVGRRVLVPLNNRKITGYILSASTTVPKTDFPIRGIIRLLDPYPLFHPGIIPFFKWIADYYHYPAGLVIKAALPGGLAVKSCKIVRLQSSAEELLSGFTKEVPEWVRRLAEKKRLPQSMTAKLISDPENKGTLTRLLREGLVRYDQIIGSDGVSEKTEVCYSFGPEALFQPLPCETGEKNRMKNGQKLVLQSRGQVLKKSETRVVQLIESLQEAGHSAQIALTDIRKQYASASKPLESLCESGILVRTERRVFRSPSGEPLPHYAPPEKLSREQVEACNALEHALQKGSFTTFLLHGVTGSGKTEVYLKAAQRALELGRDVLVLVPEIGLASALEAHFTSRFGELVVLLHSGLSKTARFDQFSLALSGRARIVIGARSAIFAPLKDPGLIVVDEEHDQGFKQDDSFRYNGRDLAIVRGKLQEAVVVLGSATPAVTSYANAAAGKYRLLRMESRIGEKIMPGVQLVDLNSKEARQDSRILKKALRDRIKITLDKGRQTILLINRRGFSNALLCRDCGTSVQCSHCHVALTYHQEKNRLICHYCGFSTRRETVCHECRSVDLAPVGIGIERVEEEVKSLFPEAAVARLDSDTVADRKKLHAILKRMHQGKIDILVGTQMIAKGHHFPDVTLVGVVWADGGINMPDFRAAERTFQLLTQVTGRAGRGDIPGDVIIQTMRPEHYSIICARNHDYKALYEREMQARKGPGFPPHVRMTAVHFKGPVESRVQQSAQQAARFFRDMKVEGRLEVMVLGPAPSPLDKIKDNFRWQLLLKARSSETLKGMCRALKASQSSLLHRTCTLTIDVDPENLM